jgi:hypothetical protein
MNNRLGMHAVRATLLCFALSLCAGNALAQSAKDLLGTWTLVSAKTDMGGNITDTFGANAKGMVTFDSAGRYVLMIIGPSLPKFASNNRLGGTADEYKAVVSGSIAHFGSYVVNEADKTLVFRIESATFPNWDKTEQKRAMSLTGDDLSYKVAAASGGGSATVTWKRAK